MNLSISEKQSSIIAVLILPGAIGFYFLLDYMGWLSLTPSYFTFTLIYLAILRGLLLVLLWHKRYLTLVPALVLTAAVTLVYPPDWNPRKPFLKQSNTLQVGMTASQVHALMHDYNRETSSGENDVIMEAYRYTNEAWGDADMGLSFIGTAMGS